MPLALLIGLFCLFTSALAHAELHLEVHPVFGAQATPAHGWSEIAVRIDNDDAQAKRGTIEFSSQTTYGREVDYRVRAPFAVGPGSSATVLLPVYDMGYAVSQRVSAIDDQGRSLAWQDLPYVTRPGQLLVDVVPGSKLPIALRDASIPAKVPHVRGATPQPLTVGQPKWNATTGDPILPLRAAGYGSAATVLIASDQLVKLTGPELEALNGYVLGGGQLAIVIRRPEDLRHPTLHELTGGEPTQAPPPKELWLPPPEDFEIEPWPGPDIEHPELERPELPPSPNPPATSRPFAPPSSEVADGFVGHAGGKLRPSRFGASATYGLGEVHLLAFDPTQPPALEDPWSQARIVELVQHAVDRQQSFVFANGPTEHVHLASSVHRQLDPNENSRFAVLFVGLALLLYAIIAGPVNFSRAAKKGRPLRALAMLPLLSAGTFVAIVVFGIFAKGLQGRARHLTLIQAGAGAERASAHRFRGFFVANGEELSVRTTDAASVIRRSDAVRDVAEQTLFVDRDGSRLIEMQSLPWETLVVRENGFATLGSGISIVPREGGDATIVNRTGRDLRGVIVHVPGRPMTYFSRLGDGDSVLASSGRTARIRGGGVYGHRGFDASAIGELLEPDVPGLGKAWQAILGAAGFQVDWFPHDTPVLLAQLDGGEGMTVDSSVKLESDRALVRVLGWGGMP